jgi:serine/threonine protein kinase
MVKVGDWELGEVLGQGGMGVVYAASHALIDGDFAIKMLRAELAKDPSVVKRFLAEVQKARLLDHPNIIRMEIPFRFADSIYLPMERLRGSTLAQLMHDDPRPWPLDRTVDLMLQAASGLGHAHAHHVLHRDVKPENLFVTNNGRVKVLDFGLAKRIGDTSLTAQGMAVGTPVYMAPEVLRGQKPGAPSDIYSLGVILFRLLTGRLPIPVQNSAATLAELFGPVLHAHEKGLPRASSHRPGLPEWLDELCARLLDKDPEHRPANGADLARVLEQNPVRADGSPSLHTPPAPMRTALSAPPGRATPAPIVGQTPAPLPPSVTSPSLAMATLPATPLPPLPASNPSVPVELPRTFSQRWGATLGLGAGLIILGIGLTLVVTSQPPRPGPAVRAAGPAPTPAEATAELVTTTFSSDPEGATVMAEGSLICRRTPCSGRVPLGHRYVTMRLDRHEPYDALVEITADSAGVHAKLTPKFGRIEFSTTPVGVVVYVDGVEWGPSPVAARELEPGRHTVEVRDRRFRRAAREFIVERGDSKRIELRLSPAPSGAAPAPAPTSEFDEFFELDVPAKKRGGTDPAFQLQP